MMSVLFVTIALLLALHEWFPVSVTRERSQEEAGLWGAGSQGGQEAHILQEYQL